MEGDDDDDDDDDVMMELAASPHSNRKKVLDYSPPAGALHLKTYTGGEDASRLALAAKEFGLQEQRKPRRQVRASSSSSRRRPTLSQLSKSIGAILLDPNFMNVRVRAAASVWTSSSHYYELLSLDEDLASTDVGASSMIMNEKARLYSKNNLQESMELSTRNQDDDGHAQEEGIGGTMPSAILGIIKAMVGPAILYLPHGFATAGWVVALPLLALTTILYLYSSRCLLDCWKLESSSSSSSSSTLTPNEQLVLLDDGGNNNNNRKKRRAILSYPELAYRALGTRGETSVKTGIALMQSGVCLTYLIFVPQNLHTSMQILFGWNIQPEVWLSVMVLIQLPLSWVRDIRKFTWTNLIANTLILYGLVTCLGFALRAMMKDSETTGLIATMWNRLIHLTPFHSSWFLFIGTSVLLFEGSITLLVPLQEAVQDEHDRERFPAVYVRVILCIIAFYTVFAMICWMSFGDNVRTVLTTSLPASTLATSVQFAYSIAVIFTFPLQNFPCLEIAYRSISKQLNQVEMIPSFWKRRSVIASGLVCLLACVAVLTMESLDKVVSLFGSLLGCPIAFVFPPLIHSQLDPNLSSRRRIGNYVVASLGIVTMILASIATIIA